MKFKLLTLSLIDWLLLGLFCNGSNNFKYVLSGQKKLVFFEKVILFVGQFLFMFVY